MSSPADRPNPGAGHRVDELVAAMLQGSPRALARLITMVENDACDLSRVYALIHPHTGRARILGITGSPGTGKSTLTDKLVAALRRRQQKVGVIAVDPSSPFTGGALLGDRIRMQRVALDPEVFIRSMATRGHLGGVARATGAVVKLMEAFGKDWVVIETVGVGQDEVDIASLADTTLVVLAPGLGDAIQSMKAGVMEIAHVFVINKADRSGADNLVAEVRARVEQDVEIHRRPWKPPVVKTIALEDQGTEEVLAAVEDHQRHLEATGAMIAARQRRTRQELLSLLQAEILRFVLENQLADGKLDQLVAEIVAKRTDPYTAVAQVLQALGLETATRN